MVSATAAKGKWNRTHLTWWFPARAFSWLTGGFQFCHSNQTHRTPPNRLEGANLELKVRDAPKFPPPHFLHSTHCKLFRLSCGGTQPKNQKVRDRKTATQPTKDPKNLKACVRFAERRKTLGAAELVEVNHQVKHVLFLGDPSRMVLFPVCFAGSGELQWLRAREEEEA